MLDMFYYEKYSRSLPPSLPSSLLPSLPLSFSPFLPHSVFGVAWSVLKIQILPQVPLSVHLLELQVYAIKVARDLFSEDVLM